MIPQQLLQIEPQYFPPFSVFAYLLQHDISIIRLDTHQHYQKKSYRNRMHIANSQGLFRLTIPLSTGKNKQLKMKDVTIANSENWQAEHWKSIVSAYNRSPFFEFYKDELEDLYHAEYDLLYHWNIDCLQWALEQLQCSIEIQSTKNYLPIISDGIDARDWFLPSNKNSMTIKSENGYQQVFSDRYPFIKNLSVLDVLFNLGPSSKRYLSTVQLHQLF